MHTWALFSCSSLITLTAYNLAQLPKIAKPTPEPEPDASGKFAADTKFSLDTLSSMFAEFEPTIAQPPLPEQPQLSKLDELPGYNPALYDPAQYPVQEADLVATLAEANLDFPMPDKVVTYRADTPKTISAPPPLPLPVRDPLPLAIAAAPPTTALPQPEVAAATPNFAQAPGLTAVAPVSTSRATAPTVASAATRPTAPAPGTPSAASTAIAPGPGPDAAPVSPDLFAALPTPTTPIAADRRPSPADSAVRQPEPPPSPTTNAVAASRQLMAEPIAFEFSEPSTGKAAASPDSPMSMDLAMTRHDLINRYCDRAPTDRQTSTKLAVCEDGTNELAQRIPEAATAGTPIPGRVESPTRNNPAMGVRQSGNKPLSAAIAGP